MGQPSRHARNFLPTGNDREVSVGIGNRARSLVAIGPTKSPTRTCCASISLFAYGLFCIYIVRAHCPRRIFNTSPTPVPGSRQDPLIPVLPSIQLFRILLLCSQSSTSVRCLHTTTEVSYIYSLPTTQANLYIVLSLIAVVPISRPLEISQ